AELSLKLVGQLIIPIPASLPQADHEFASQLRGSVHALHHRRDDTVASQLQRIIIGANAAEQVNDSGSVTPIYGRTHAGALVLWVHLALRSVALPGPSRGPSSAP